MRKLVVIDAGHYDAYNQFLHNSEYNEGGQMFKLAMYLRDALAKRGVDTKMTKASADLNPTLTARGRLAGNNKANMFISLHSNAFGTSGDQTVDGVEVIYSLADIEKNKPIAESLSFNLSKVMENKNRGAYTKADDNNSAKDYFGVLRSSSLYGCKCAFIVEHGFHTNEKDEAFLIDDNKLKTLADKEAEIIALYLNRMSNVEKTDSNITDMKFSIKENDKVKIKNGAIYGGASKGKVVPDFVLKETHTVKKISVHGGEPEALLKEIISWVPVKYLIKA